MHTYVRVHPYTWRDIDGWTTISRYFNAAPCYRSGLGLRHRVLRSCLLPRNSPFPVPKRSQLFICDAELASFFCCADCLGARLEGYNRAQRRNSQLHVFLTAPHQNQEPQRGIEPRGVLSLSVMRPCCIRSGPSRLGSMRGPSSFNSAEVFAAVIQAPRAAARNPLAWSGKNESRRLYLERGLCPRRAR